jgi:hypothetical protein
MTEITDEYMLEMRAKTKQYTFMLLKNGPNRFVDGVDAVIWEHGRRNHALRADGVLAIVCPCADDTPVCGLGLFDASPEEVIRIMDGDPGVQAGVFEYEVHPVRSFPGDQLPA